MACRPTILRSRFLAAAVTSAVVLVMLAPLRSGSQPEQIRQASWSSLLNLGGLADSRAFHRQEKSATHHLASQTPLLRAVTTP